MQELESAIKRARDEAGSDVKAGLEAAIKVCEDAKQRLLEMIRAANHRYGIDHADRVFVRDMPAELQALNRQHQRIGWRIGELEEELSRVVVRPDGETIILPRGHTLAGFTEDGKVVSGHMTVIHHEDVHPRRSPRSVARPAQRRMRERRPRVARRAASSSRTSSADPGDPDEPAPATLRVRRPSGATATFHATACTIKAGVITAIGSWDDLWPARRVLQVRWLEVVA